MAQDEIFSEFLLFIFNLFLKFLNVPVIASSCQPLEHYLIKHKHLNPKP
jgi:hypothetical protein